MAGSRKLKVKSNILDLEDLKTVRKRDATLVEEHDEWIVQITYDSTDAEVDLVIDVEDEREADAIVEAIADKIDAETIDYA